DWARPANLPLSCMMNLGWLPAWIPLRSKQPIVVPCRHAELTLPAPPVTRIVRRTDMQDFRCHRHESPSLRSKRASRMGDIGKATAIWVKRITQTNTVHGWAMIAEQVASCGGSG